jgi:hypothetical protein
MGLLFGAGMWAMSYVQLVPMSAYERPWKHPPKEVSRDVSYNLVYAAGFVARLATRGHQPRIPEGPSSCRGLTALASIPHEPVAFGCRAVLALVTRGQLCFLGRRRRQTS